MNHYTPHDMKDMIRTSLNYKRSALNFISTLPMLGMAPVRPVRTLSPSRANTQSASFGQLLRFTLLFVVMMMGAVVWGQSVIMYGDYYLKHDANGHDVETASSTGFNPSSCIWYINNRTIKTADSNGAAFDGNYFLQNNAISLGNSSTWITAANGGNLQGTNGNYLRRRNGGDWQIGNSNNNRATAYAVTISSNIGNFSISGDATITATGTNSSYSHTNANYYDIYSFNSRTYYSTDPSVAASTTAPTSGLPTLDNGYTWSISSNSYATVNPSSGAITVSSLPANDTDVTLTCSITRNGVTKTATKTITIEAPKVDPESITVTTPMTVYVGQTGTVSYTLTPSLCYNNVTFESSATGVATVSIDGTVTGVSAGTATITVTAKKIDGTTNASLTKTVTVTVKDKVATPVITFTPDATDNTKATASITCATPGTTISYKVNDGTYAEYSSAINVNVNENDIVYAKAVKNPADANWEDSDEATATYVSCTTDAPTISYVQSGTTSTVTITAETGATIYYTTNGDNPTTSSTSGTTTVTINSVAGGTTVKAIAKSGTCQASEIKEIITPGVSGGTVILNDLEDHKWSYYSDASTPAQLHSLNPADVKITYYGDGIMMTGNADYTASSTEKTDYIVKSSENANYVGGAKVNVGGEDENTFIYYKTLERENADGSGRCPYKPIPNPFQVRPTYGTPPTSDRASWTGWRGFQCWRLKSFTGGAVYSAASGGTALSVGAIINAETEIYFAPSAEYGMDVQLEAVWSIAYLVYANGNGNWSVPNHADLGYERNFVVLSTNKEFYFGGGGAVNNSANIVDINRPSTITPYLPDGTSGNGQIGKVRGNNNITLQANTKFENVQFSYMANNNSRTLTAAGHDLIIGRGCSGTVDIIQGINGNYNDDLNYTMRIENGTVSTLAYVAEISCAVSGRVQVKAIMGSDYDRAKKDNSLLSISNNGNLFFTRDVSFSNASNKDQKVFDLVVKSGEFQKGYWDTDENPNGITGTNGFNYVHSMYCGANFGNGNPTHYPGARYVTIEGGALGNINGGRGTSTAGNNDNPDATTTQTDHSKISFDLRIKKDAVINGCVFGGAANTSSWGSKRIVLTGGKVLSWIAGGANGTNTTDGDSRTRGSAYIYVGGTAEVGGPNAKMKNSTLGGQVFGAGRGNTKQAASMDYSYVAIADDAKIMKKNNDASGNVYGGGNIGYTHKQSNIYILGGTVEGSVYGGAYSNALNIPEVNITMTGGTVLGGVYGGSNSSGTISGNVTMQIDGGQVGTSSASANIHGGGLGSSTRVNGNVELTLGTTSPTEPGVTVYGDVYGGSALGYVNGESATNTYHTNVTLNKGTINGSLYGGGLGEGTTAANVYGPVTVTVNGGSVKDPDGDAPDSNPGSIFGCNNVYGSPQRAVSVTVNATDPTTTDGSGNKIYAINGVYGGGNQAHYDYDNADNPTVTINGCESSIKDVYGGGNAAAVPSTHVTIKGGDIDRVFGGGNGESGTPAHIGYKNKTENSTASAYNANGNVTLDINGGTINQVFGGSNAHGTIKGSIAIGIAKSGTCEMHIGEVYGGGNEAAGNAGTITIGCTGGDTEGIGDVYGGANAADVNNNIELTITGGSIQRVFGGNNASGSISGTIQVNVNWNTTDPCGYNYLGSVFGGGNQAAYGSSGANKGDYPVVTILNGTVSNNVFGGGLGATAIVYGNPQVTIGDNTDGHVATVGGDVYGGGDAAAVEGTPVVKVVNKCNTTIANVYGGGNAADVNGTDVNIDGGTITGMVFGGGHGDKNTNPQKQADVNGNVSVDITGGTINKVFGGSNSKGNITGTVAVNIAKGTNSCDMHITEVYGGGNEAAGNAGTITIGCTGDYANNQEGIGDVYGGANAADINNNISLAIRGGHIDRVFGGNNSSGAINGTIAVEVNWDNALTCDKYLGNVFGGGNLAAYTGSPTVTLTNGTVSHNVYGGGNEAGVGGSTVNINGGSVLDGIYGGCNASGTVGGDILVTLSGGTVGASATKANVHGGGFGKETATSGNVTVNIGTVDNSGSTPVYSGTAVIYGDVYGGSALGDVNSDTGDFTYVNLNKGTIHGDAYGGGLGSTSEPAWVFGNVMVTQNGVIFIKSIATEKNADGSDIVNGGRIFGCNNLNGSPKGTVLVLVTKTTPETPPASGEHTKGIYDMAAVYGGGNLAAYDPTNAKTATGQYAEGGHDAAGKPLQVVIDGCSDISIEYVYGGGNAAATPATDVVVLGAYELGNVFGGGNGKDKISYDGTTWTANPGADVGIIDQTAYATDNSTGTYGTGKSLASLLGGTIHYAFGGSNTKGNVLSEATVYLNENESDDGCPLKIDEVYGGGNEAYMAGDTQIQLGCISYLKEIYGGAKAADLGGNVVLTITSGSFDRVFGGNNVSGCINGSITVNIEETGCHPIVIGELYAGGNQAGYSIYGYKEVTEGGKQVWKPRESATDAGTGPATPFASPELNVKSFTSIGRIFGGGFGETAVMVGDPTVNINEVEGTKSNKNVTDGNYSYDTDATTGHFDTNGNFKGWAIEYKDDSLNPTTVTSTVNVPTHNKGKIGAIGTVFGGGNAAKVIGNTNVNIGTLSKITYVSGTDSSEKDVIGVDIRENVFGGGNQADVTGNTNVVVGK